MDLSAFSDADRGGRSDRRCWGKAKRGKSHGIDRARPRESFFLLIALERNGQGQPLFAIGVRVKEVALPEFFLDSANLFIGTNFIRQQ
jgi:hypothetical protein